MELKTFIESPPWEWPEDADRIFLEALESENQDIFYEAVCAAGNWDMDAAWSHIAALITSKDTEKYMLMAAIEAVASIRPQEAAQILIDLTPALHKNMTFYYPLITLLFATRREIEGDLVLQRDWHSLSGSIHPEAW